MDVGGWLRGLGLGEYEAAFRENRIDADILAELDDADLKQLGQFDDARRCIEEARTVTDASKETWSDAGVHRVTGEIVLTSGQRDMAKAEACFERALTVARSQHRRSTAGFRKASSSLI